MARAKPKTQCKTCKHKERKRIEELIANGLSGPKIADKFGLSTDSIYKHRRNHMTQERIAALRLGIADELDVNIEEITRTEGENIILSLRALRHRLESAESKYEQLGDHASANRARELILKTSDRIGKMSGHFPGRAGTVNNTLVLGDFTPVLEQIDSTLKAWPEARRAVAAIWREQAEPGRLLEHAA